MSSLWTPSGEHAPEPDEPDQPAYSEAPGFTDEELTELARVRAEIAATPVADLVANHAVGLWSLEAMTTVQHWRLAVTRSLPGFVVLTESAHSAEIRIRNRGRLPEHFDYEQGNGTRTGLELVRTLLGLPSGMLKFRTRKGTVEVTLRLGAPLVANHARGEAVGASK